MTRFATFALLAAALAAPLVGIAQTAERPSFVLPYRGDNRWVHVDDNRPLVALFEAARVRNAATFDVIVPDNAASLATTERLEVLATLLSGRQKKGVTLRQINGATPANTLTVLVGD
jgi:hypothetical protein